MREVAEWTITDVCTIVRTTYVSDGQGGMVPAVSVSTPQPANLVDRAGLRDQSTDVIKLRGQFLLVLRQASDVVITDTINYYGRTFRVVWLPQPAPSDSVRQIGLEEIVPVAVP